MAEITSITPQIKDKERVNIYLDGKFYCGMKLETALRYRLKVGDHVEFSRLDEIQLENEKSQALDKAMTHLTASMKTQGQMRDFLKKKGYVDLVIDAVLEKLKEYGFVNDEEYCRQFVESASKNKGKRLLAVELKKRGAAEDSIVSVLEDLQDESDAAKSVLGKYMKGREITRENLQKAYRHLLSKGFDYDTAKDAISSLKEDE